MPRARFTGLTRIKYGFGSPCSQCGLQGGCEDRGPTVVRAQSTQTPVAPSALSQTLSPMEAPLISFLIHSHFALLLLSAKVPKLLRNPQFPAHQELLLSLWEGVSIITCPTFPVFPLSPVLKHTHLSSEYFSKTFLAGFCLSFPHHRLCQLPAALTMLIILIPAPAFPIPPGSGPVSQIPKRAPLL